MTELADVLNQFGDQYIEKYKLSPEQYQVFDAIEYCRTSKQGGHVDVCDHCGHLRISYNSCRNRHCPKCQGLKTEEWINKRKNDLLPIQYYHIVFTIPNELNDLVLRNKREMYSLLFKASSSTLKELAADPKHLGAKIGFISLLHTWGQNLLDHPHIHCIVTGGGLSLDNNKWVSSRDNFFIHVKVLSALFKGKFLYHLKKLYYQQKLIFPGKIEDLKNESNFKALLNRIYNKDWVVFSKPSFKDPKFVIEYLGRYTNKVAIANHRIIKIEGDKVMFKFKDYSDNNKIKVMSLDALEFIRRFLLHVLPKGLVRIRYYGLLSNRFKKANLRLSRYLLHVFIKEDADNSDKETWQELLLRLTGKDLSICPECGKGKMIPDKTFSYIRPSPVYR